MVAIVPAVNIVAVDVEVPTPTPRPSTLAAAVTGTPGTDGQIAYGTYHGYPVKEPHRVFKFDVTLPSIPGIADRDRPVVQSVEPSFDNTGPESHPIGGRHGFLAGYFDAHELRMLFYDDEDQTPIEYINAWKKLMRNYSSDGIDDGTYNYPDGPNGYYRDIYVDLLDMQSRIRYKITYRKCFPTVMAPLRLDYEPSARTVIAQSFSVNRIITRKQTVQSSTANPSPMIPAGAALAASLQRLQI